ncbi:hypothetical protein AN958_10221 [Leucoagaricus sp. SymC.cos]|nr:hypothetical protein AN958_10221 [Leucoagaricus sp. SymC.cos]
MNAMFRKGTAFSIVNAPFPWNWRAILAQSGTYRLANPLCPCGRGIVLPICNGYNTGALPST